MRLSYPRAPHTIVLTIRGQQVETPRIGYAQMMALEALDKFAGNKEPPKDLVTATGVLRKHVFNDMIPFGWVTVKRAGDSGEVDYFLTKRGREILRTAEVADAPTKKARRELLKRQRARAAKSKKGKAGQRTRRMA